MKMIFVFLAVFFEIGVRADGVVGRWQTVDDSSGKLKSIVEIYKDGDLLKGRITELLDPSEDPICAHCPGDKKGKSVIGMEIMWDMKETEPGKEWAEGHILDPKSGHTYRCRLRIKDDPDKLEVRGYLGISLLGRTQNWLRAKSANAP